jgi:hypothetical protein
MQQTLSGMGAWALLEQHFARHKLMVARFREFGPTAVVRMWRTQTNESGERLAAFEREALAERYCELLGEWPLQSS